MALLCLSGLRLFVSRFYHCQPQLLQVLIFFIKTTTELIFETLKCFLQLGLDPMEGLFTGPQGQQGSGPNMAAGRVQRQSPGGSPESFLIISINRC